jgi:hypothetical protein
MTVIQQQTISGHDLLHDNRLRERDTMDCSTLFGLHGISVVQTSPYHLRVVSVAASTARADG